MKFQNIVNTSFWCAVVILASILVIGCDDSEDTENEPPYTYEEFTFVPAGSFVMGDNLSGCGAPERLTTLTNDFYLGTCEVTNLDYVEALEWAWEQGFLDVTADAVFADSLLILRLPDYGEIVYELAGLFRLVEVTSMGFSYDSLSSWGPGIVYPDGYNVAEFPVQQVTWYGAALYCDWRSMMEGLPPFYDGNWDQTEEHNPYLASGYRLPTEAEWEYAARYDDGRFFPWGNSVPDSTYLNVQFSDHYLGWTSRVGSYPRGLSQLGLMDMLGNVSEWVGDWGDYSTTHGPESIVNPLGLPAPTDWHRVRVYKGSSWYRDAEWIHLARRGCTMEDGYRMGFRVCRTAD